MAIKMIINKNLRIRTFKAFDYAILIGANMELKITRRLTEKIIRFHLDANISLFSEEEFDALRKKGVIIEECSRGISDTSLSEKNWNSANDYLRDTYDYPFFNYREEGWLKDRSRMKQYHEQEPEISRSKRFYGADYVDFSKLKHDVEPVAQAVSHCLKAQGYLPLSNSSPLLKKCAPSGGGRHPSEAYVLDMARNQIWHYQAEDNQMAMIGDGSTDVYDAIFGDLEDYTNFEVNFAVIISCVWERNMYRYRENRTFRSVHADAGHALELIDSYLRKSRYNTKIQYNISEKNFAGVIGASPYWEGAMAGILIGKQCKNG